MVTWEISIFSESRNFSYSADTIAWCIQMAEQTWVKHNDPRPCIFDPFWGYMRVQFDNTHPFLKKKLLLMAINKPSRSTIPNMMTLLVRWAKNINGRQRSSLMYTSIIGLKRKIKRRNFLFLDYIYSWKKLLYYNVWPCHQNEQ